MNAQNEAAQDEIARDEFELASALVRMWGPDALMKANDNAFLQASIGNDTAVSKWLRVMVMISDFQQSRAEPRLQAVCA